MRSTYTPKHARPRRSLTTRTAALTGAALTSAAVAAGGAIAPASAATAAPVAAAPVATAAGYTWTIWDSLAKCESGNRWSYNGSSGYDGGLQFLPATWVGYGGTRYAPYAWGASRVEQILIAQKVLRDVGPRAWPVCSRKVGLTRTNGIVYGDGASRDSERTSTSYAYLASKRLVVDGSYGKRSQAVTQRWLKRGIDGSMSRDDYRALQRKLGVYPDGYFGPKSTAALQRYLGIWRDGRRLSDSPRTVKAFQAHLNRQVFG